MSNKNLLWTNTKKTRYTLEKKRLKSGWLEGNWYTQIALPGVFRKERSSWATTVNYPFIFIWWKILFSSANNGAACCGTWQNAVSLTEYSLYLYARSALLLPAAPLCRYKHNHVYTLFRKKLEERQIYIEVCFFPTCLYLYPMGWHCSSAVFRASSPPLDDQAPFVYTFCTHMYICFFFAHSFGDVFNVYRCTQIKLTNAASRRIHSFRPGKESAFPLCRGIWPDVFFSSSGQYSISHLMCERATPRERVLTVTI